MSETVPLDRQVTAVVLGHHDRHGLPAADLDSRAFVDADLDAFNVDPMDGPQVALLKQEWTVPVGTVQVPMLAVLLGTGLLGYGYATWNFSRRDLPAPL